MEWSLTAAAPLPDSLVAPDSVLPTERRVVAILRNPRSGSHQRATQVLALIQELRRLGLIPRLFRHRQQLQRWMEQRPARAHLRCLVAAGGDGTVGELLTRFPGVPLAILPLGNENVLAQYARVPRDGVHVARLIAAGHLRPLDIGEVNGRRFALMLSVGVDADIIHHVHHHRRGHVTYANYVLPLLQQLNRRTWPVIRVRADDGSEWTTSHLWIFNVPRYVLGLKLADGASDHDGQLDLRALRSSATSLRSLMFRLWRWGLDPADWICSRSIRFTLESEQPVAIQIDGDPIGHTPAVVTLIPQGLQLVVSASVAGAAKTAEAAR